MSNLKRKLKRLEETPALILGRQLVELRRLADAPSEVRSRWIEALTDAELQAIIQSFPGDLSVVTDEELERMVAGESPEAVLGADRARVAGLIQ